MFLLFTSWEEHTWEPGQLQRNKRMCLQAAATSGEGCTRLPGIGEASARHQMKARIVTSLIANFNALLCVPIEASCTITRWLVDDSLNLYDQSKEEYKLAVSRFKRLTSQLEIKSIIALHQQANSPVYYSRSTNHYMSIEESLEQINKLLLHQYKTQESVNDFLKTLFLVCERKAGKMNSIFIKGKPNCGKTWFVDCLAAFYINVGHVKNFVRGQNFPLNDCPNRRILVWNEPSIMPSAFDSVKMLAGGDSCPAAVKYEGDCVISKTPLIFTSNTDIFGKTQVWTSRILFTEWVQSPFLKDVHLKPHPRVFETLFNKYI